MKTLLYKHFTGISNVYDKLKLMSHSEDLQKSKLLVLKHLYLSWIPLYNVLNIVQQTILTHQYYKIKIPPYYARKQMTSILNEGYTVQYVSWHYEESIAPYFLSDPHLHKIINRKFMYSSDI